jgi:hypothetical protein
MSRSASACTIATDVSGDTGIGVFHSADHIDPGGVPYTAVDQIVVQQQRSPARRRALERSPEDRNRYIPARERRQHLTKPFRSRDRVILVAVGDEARWGRRVLVRTQGDGQHAASAVHWRPSDAVSHRLVPPRVALVGFSVTVKSRSNDQEADHPSWVIGL